MNIEQIHKYCIKKKGVTEDFPFNEETLVFKVMGKMFLLASLDSLPLQINLKCDPEKAIELREEYESVQPGYHTCLPVSVILQHFGNAGVIF